MVAACCITASLLSFTGSAFAASLLRIISSRGSAIATTIRCRCLYRVIHIQFQTGIVVFRVNIHRTRRNGAIQDHIGVGVVIDHAYRRGYSGCIPHNAHIDVDVAARGASNGHLAIGCSQSCRALIYFHIGLGFSGQNRHAYCNGITFPGTGNSRKGGCRIRIGCDLDAAAGFICTRSGQVSVDDNVCCVVDAGNPHGYHCLGIAHRLAVAVRRALSLGHGNGLADFHLGSGGHFDIIARDGTVLPDVDRSLVLFDRIIGQERLVRSGFFARQLVDDAIKYGFVLSQNLVLQDGTRQSHGSAVFVGTGAFCRELYCTVAAGDSNVLPDVDGSSKIRRAFAQMDRVGFCLFLALSILFHVAFVIQNRLGILDYGLLLCRQDNIAARAGNGSQTSKARICPALNIHQIRKIQTLCALKLGAVLDVDDAGAQHGTAVGVDLPAYVNGFVVGIGVECINGSHGDIRVRILGVV